jgi:hypothetical protein
VSPMYSRPVHPNFHGRLPQLGISL